MKHDVCLSLYHAFDLIFMAAHIGLDGELLALAPECAEYFVYYIMLPEPRF